MFHHPKVRSFALSGCALLVLSACGGGSESTPETPAPAKPVTLSGTVVVDQAVQNAVVCMDLNANNACDASEPASAKTGADGAYSLTYLPANVTAEQAARSSLVAQITPAAAGGAGSIDAANPGAALTEAAYVLKQAPGKSGPINPLTTLVSAGVAQGMTEAVARANVATQLAIAEAKIDNYQDDPATNPAQVRDNARSMAMVTAAALAAGAALEVGDQTAAVSAAPGNLVNLRYNDAGNYSVRTLDVEAKAAGTDPGRVKDARSGKTNGVATPESGLYTQAYLSGSGWTFCNASVNTTVTQGNPSRSKFCNAQEAAGFTTRESIAGSGMSALVTQLQTSTNGNPINDGVPTANLLAALGTAVFPANASLQKRVNLNVTQPVYINSVAADGLPATITSLEQVIAGYPSSKVTLSNGRGTLGLGLAGSDAKVLRVAFGAAASPTEGAAQFYECDFDAVPNTIANCRTTQTGTYALKTENGVRVLRYAGFPETIMGHTRLHAEATNIAGLAPRAASTVFVVRENKPSLAINRTPSTRLDATAWGAMRTSLGL